jgi:hypothetical protein
MFENHPEISDRRYVIPIRDGFIFLEESPDSEKYYNVCIRPSDPMRDELAFYFQLSFDANRIPKKGLYLNDVHTIQKFGEVFRDWKFHEMIDLFNYNSKKS